MRTRYYDVSLTSEEVEVLYKALDLIKKQEPNLTKEANSVVVKLEGADSREVL